MVPIGYNTSLEVKSLLTGLSWTGYAQSSAIVNYTVLNRNVSPHTLRSVLEEMEAVANIDFNNQNAPYVLANPYATVSFSAGQPVAGDPAMLVADIYIGQDAINAGISEGEAGYQAAMHEVLHGLGLKHPNPQTAVDIAPFHNISMDHSILSNIPGTYVNWATPASSPMLYDIAALQHLYGANHSHNAGNDTYRLFDDGGRQTIWDGGGIDTLRTDYNTNNVHLDLNEGEAHVNTVGTSATWIAFGANIENAVGGRNNDTIHGNNLDNVLKGKDGNDWINGNAGNDTIYGNQANDTLWGNTGEDHIYGGRGNDMLYGNVNNDTLYGNRGTDTICGGQNNDTIFGNHDNDMLYGNRGDDHLYGGKGNDTLYGGEGSDTLQGNRGSDIFVFDEDIFTGHDIIEDFSRQDEVDVSALGWTQADVQSYAHVAGNNLVLYDDTNPSAWSLTIEDTANYSLNTIFDFA